MKKLLFIDHSYHAKTRATAFLQELLAAHFELEVLWDESWNGGPAPSAPELNAKRPDAIVFFQLLPEHRTLRSLDCPNITWVPMRDGLRYRSKKVRRLNASGIKVLNFCAEAHAFFLSRKQETLRVQYWPAPELLPRPPVQARPRIFFWPRLNVISWNTLKTLLGNFRPQGIVLRYALDPGNEISLPSQEDIAEYNITVLQGWLGHDVYLAKLRECDIFMAPRPDEGIGQAMLEAMRNGLAVITPNAPTMNEYVQDGRSGWFYELANPAPLDFSHWAGRGDVALAQVASGHQTWLTQAPEIAAFVAKPPANAPNRYWKILKALGY